MVNVVICIRIRTSVSDLAAPKKCPESCVISAFATFICVCVFPAAVSFPYVVCVCVYYATHAAAAHITDDYPLTFCFLTAATNAQTHTTLRRSSAAALEHKQTVSTSAMQRVRARARLMIDRQRRM